MCTNPVRTHWRLAAWIVGLGLLAGSAPVAAAPEIERVPLHVFYELFAKDDSVYRNARDHIFEDWQVSSLPMILETARFGSRRRDLMARVQRATGQDFDGDLDRASIWLWSLQYRPHPGYPLFKARLYGNLDPRFEAYFDDATGSARIRLDEIRWGGVARDGIPPLSRPQMIAAEDADYLDADNIVFGIEINGDVRAYPKRILAWHEMFKDRVGDVSVNGVYCTLCGTMILYKTEHAGTHHELGTSGFLYRSNKLMYDHATESLWSTVRGEPVVGPLVGKGIQLESLSVVTTTWGKWRSLHPKTRVLSLETGHTRDYGEGVAYRDYFSTDELMFTVPQHDERLRNKAEVLIPRIGVGQHPLAIESAFLRANPVYHGSHAGQDYVVLTDSSGAHRIYQAGAVVFDAYDGATRATDEDGQRWVLSERALTAATGERLTRLASHNAFWFGWHAAYPGTRLIQR